MRYPEEGMLSRSKYFVMTDADAEQLSNLLVQKFPTMKFVDTDEWNDHDFYKTTPRPADRLVVPYRPNLAGRWRGVKAWLEPPGWDPLWLPLPPDKFYRGPQRYAIYNKPPYFTYQPSLGIRTGDLNEGRAWSAFHKDDLDHRRFIATVFRIIEKISTRQVDYVESSGKVIHANIRVRTCMGLDAIEWCKEDPSRRLMECYLPAGSPGASMKEWSPEEIRERGALPNTGRSRRAADMLSTIAGANAIR